MPVSAAILAASFRIAAPSARASAPAPRIIIGRLASFSTCAKAWLPLAIGFEHGDVGAQLLDRIGQIDRPRRYWRS